MLNQERIHRVIAALSPRLGAGEVADGVVEEVAATLGARAVAVMLFDEKRDRMSLVRAMGYPPEVLDRWTNVPLREMPLVVEAMQNRVVLGPARKSDQRFDSNVIAAFGDGAGGVVPLSAGGKVIGVIGISWAEVREVPPEERDFIQVLAAHCALTLERARLFEAERQARAEADATRQLLEAVLQQLPIAVSLVGPTMTVINDEARKIYQTPIRTLTEEQRASYSPAAIKGPDGTPYDETSLPIRRAMRGEVVAEECTIVRGDGQERALMCHAGPIRDGAGAQVSAVAVFADVTEERQTAAELRASERRYQLVLRATSDVIWELDPVKKEVVWNGALERVFGYRPEETAQHPQGGYGWWVEHMHPDDAPGVLSGYTQALESGAESWGGEYRFRRADGVYVPTLDRCVFSRDAQGNLLRVVGAMSDVSEQHRLLGELREAVAVRDDFISIAGHELRTPLAALSAQLTGIRQMPLDETRREQKLEAADRQVRRLASLIDGLLNVSRIMHGKLQLSREEVDLGVVTAEAAARLQEDFQRGGTTLAIQTVGPVPGHWDRLRIDLVVTNLLMNALRYGERKPVTVRVEADAEWARVIVEDRGIGIRAEDQKRIFERFVRLVPSRQFGGLGIGLWLSRQVVEAHGGRLRVESEEGRGSRFTVELPRS